MFKQQKYDHPDQVPAIHKCMKCFSLMRYPIKHCIEQIFICKECKSKHIASIDPGRAQYHLRNNWITEINYFYFKIFKNILIKCQTCSKYKSSLQYSKHIIDCKMKNLGPKDVQCKYCKSDTIQSCLNFEYHLSHQYPRSEDEIVQLQFEQTECKFCETQIPSRDYFVHKFKCQFMEVSCDNQNCQWKGVREQFNQHCLSDKSLKKMMKILKATNHLQEIQSYQLLINIDEYIGQDLRESCDTEQLE